MPFVDLHCHLLWATDDGALDSGESLQLCRSLVAAGFSEAATTPHAWPELPDAQATAARRGELQALLDASGVALRLHPGAENRLDAELLDRAARGDARPLGAGAWILVELPHRTPFPGAADLCFRLRVAGLRPLIAHPERCRAFADDKGLAERLVAAGCALQIEIGSLAGIYGKEARKIASALLDEQLVAVAASDVHRPEGGQRILDQGLPALRKAVGDRGLARLLEDNPGRVLRGESLASGPWS